MDDSEPLGSGTENHIASCVADGTAQPDEARRLLVEFVRQAGAGKVSAVLIEHVSECFAAFLAGERKLLPALEAGRPGVALVPIQTLEKAFGLTRVTRGRPAIDQDTHCAVAMEVLERMLSGDTLEVASEFVADDRRTAGLPIASETEVRDAWAKHKMDGLLWLRISRTDPSTPPWTPDEIARLTALFEGEPWFVPPGMSISNHWRKVLPDEPLPQTITPGNSENKSA